MYFLHLTNILLVLILILPIYASAHVKSVCVSAHVRMCVRECVCVSVRVPVRAPLYHAQRILFKMGPSRIAKSRLDDITLVPLEGPNFG